MTKPGFLLARSERELALQRTEGEDYDSANDLLARAEIGYRSAFGIQESQNLDQVAHPEWGAFLNDKASCLIDQGRADLALALLKPSKNIQVRVFGDRNLDVAPVMCNLALASLLTGAHKHALKVRLQEYCKILLSLLVLVPARCIRVAVSAQFGCADDFYLAPTTRTYHKRRCCALRTQVIHCTHFTCAPTCNAYPLKRPRQPRPPPTRFATTLYRSTA